RLPAPLRRRRGEFRRPFTDVVRTVRVHHQHTAGDVQIISGPTHDQDRGHSPVAVQRAYQIDERGQRLTVLGDEFLHARVSDHQVGGSGVLVHEQDTRTRLDGLDDV